LYSEYENLFLLVASVDDGTQEWSQRKGLVGEVNDVGTVVVTRQFHIRTLHNKIRTVYMIYKVMHIIILF